MGSRRIRIGNQTAPSAHPVRVPFEYAVENGFGAFEWFLDSVGGGEGWQEMDLDAEERRDVRRLAAEKDILLSVHAPWWIDPFAPGGSTELDISLDFARDLGAANLNVHLDPEWGVEAFLEAVDPLLRRAMAMGMQVSIENVPDTGPEHFNELFSRLSDAGYLGEGRVGMCLDLGHANLCPATVNDYLAYLDGLDPAVPIVHLHLHENYGDEDSHLCLFSGPSGRDPSGIEGFVHRMKGRGFAGCAILEVWPDPPSLLNQARDRLLQMFDAVPGEGRAT